jgi:hypothetical protein
MASFLDNVWNFVKKPLAAVTGFVGNIIVPGLGTAVSGIIDPPVVQAAAKAAVAEGSINTDKVAANIVKAGNAPTQENIITAVNDIKRVAVADPSIPANATTVAALPTSGTALSTTSKIMAYVKSHWYIVLGGGLLVVVVIFYFSHNSHGHTKRR